MHIFKYIFCFILCTTALYCQKKEDSNFNHLYVTGNILLNQGKYDDAISEFQKIIKKNPNEENAFCSIGLCLYSKGDYKTAIDYFTKSIKVNNDLFGSHYGRAISYEMLDEDNNAEDDYKKLIQINPKFYLAYKHLGSIEKQKGNKELSLNCYNEAIEFA